MGREAVMVVVDNSENSRNGDYPPTRFDAQADAVNIIFQAITQNNPESSVGLMSMGGKGPEVLATLTVDQGKILEGLHRTKSKIRGSAHLSTGIHIAYLALKHRQNKSQRQRIIVFVCSPVEETQKDLIKLAKKMKKENVNVDIVLFGELDDTSTREKLETFVGEVNKSDGSHFEVFPPSSKLLSDQLISTPILLGESAADGGGVNITGAGAGAGGGGGDFGDLDFDPAADPELALALRMSLEDEKARQEKKAKEEEGTTKKSSLEDVKEEDENAPLLDKSSEPPSKKDGDDKMDTS